MTAPPFVFQVAHGDGAAVVAEACAAAGADDRAVTTLDRTFLDTFDGRLRRAGLGLERRSDGVLTLCDPVAGVLTGAAAGDRHDRLLLDDVVGGPLRERLAPVLDVRAVLPGPRVRSKLSTYAVRNADEKIVARLIVEEPVVVNGRNQTPLPIRVTAVPVRGYDKALVQLRRRLGSVDGLVVAERSLLEVATTVAGLTSPPPFVAPLTGDMTAAEAAAVVSRRLADVVESNLPGTLADLDTEFLHDLRVAVRRTRALLREFATVLTGPDADRARQDLRWVQAVTGPTRDFDVHLIDWPHTVGGLSPATVTALDPLHRLLVEHRSVALAAMRRSLRSRRFRQAWDAWRTYVDQIEPRPDAPLVGVVAAMRIRKGYRRMVRDGGAISDESPAVALHDLRKRGKELRYLLEHFGGLWPAGHTGPLVRALKRLQDVLGRFQDRQVQAEDLRRLGYELIGVDHGPDALIALGVVVDRMVADQAVARAEFQAAFKPFAAPLVGRTVESTFR